MILALGHGDTKTRSLEFLNWVSRILIQYVFLLQEQSWPAAQGDRRFPGAGLDAGEDASTDAKSTHRRVQGAKEQD